MRLGAYPCRLEKDSLAHEVYGVDEISERHRHRYEVNPEYQNTLTSGGMRFGGVSPDAQLVEMIELPDHPFFLAVQFHPELKSRPNKPHPLFAAFVGAAAKRRNLLAHQSSDGLSEAEAASHSDPLTAVEGISAEG